MSDIVTSVSLSGITTSVSLGEPPAGGGITPPPPPTPQAPPGAPTGVSATPAGSTAIDLAWTTASGVVSFYSVYRGLTSGAETLLAFGVQGTSYTDTGLTSGLNYYYKITASNTGGEGPSSNEVSAAPTDTGGGSLFQETPVGAIDGTNQSFRLTHTPKGYTMIFLNGVLQLDPTVSGTTITLTSAPLPSSGPHPADQVSAVYLI